MPAWLGAVDHLLMRLLDGLIIAVAGLLLLLLNYAVFARFVLNASVSWGEELPAYLLATLTFMGAAYLTRTDEHIGFDGVLRMLPKWAQRAALMFNLTLMTLFGLVLAYFGAIAALRFVGRTLISIDFPMILFRGAMPVGALIIALVCIARLIGLMQGRLQPVDLLPKNDD